MDEKAYGIWMQLFEKINTIDDPDEQVRYAQEYARLIYPDLADVEFIIPEQFLDGIIAGYNQQTGHIIDKNLVAVSSDMFDMVIWQKG